MHATPGTDITATLERFVDSQTPRNTLGLVYGRRRIGKSTMLSALTRDPLAHEILFSGCWLLAFGILAALLCRLRLGLVRKWDA